MRLLPWLANPDNPAMSPQAEGKKGTRHNDIIYIMETREDCGEQPRNYAQRQNNATTKTRDSCTRGQQKTADCTGSQTLAQSMN